MIYKSTLIALITAFALLFFWGCNKEDNPVKESTNQQEITSDNSIASANIMRKIVVLRKGVGQNSVAALVNTKGGKVHKQYTIINAMSIRLPEKASEKALAAITKHADVLRIDNDIVVSAPPPGKKPPKDPPEPPPTEVIPWGIDRIDADLAWDDVYGGVSSVVTIKVGILDTGIDLDHPDLQDNIATGINIISTRKNENDDNGHGTHVAGTIAAVDNEIGVIGVAHQVSLYGVKVLDRKGNGYLSDLISGLEWCVNNNIDVINMSLSATVDEQSFHDAIMATYNAGITMVCAAGNDYGSVAYPAKYSETIAVSATDINDAFASFSNKGPEIDVAAPGVNIYSTYKGDAYKTYSGTSMASPHVAGVAALIIAKYSLSPDAVKTHMSNTAENIGLTSDQQGAGLIDAENAVNTTP
ncbi:S8 family peptidase [Bacteroidota bacterium]